MHTFTHQPIESLTLNPFTRLSKDWALVSAGTPEKSNTMTVSWGGVGVIWGKNVTYIFIRDSRYTKEFIDQGDTFSLAFLDESHHDALKYCGGHTGRGTDKWKDANLTPAFSDGVVYPDESKLVLLCRKMAAVPITEDSFVDSGINEKWYSDHDMHMMYVGEIVEVTAR